MPFKNIHDFGVILVTDMDTGEVVSTVKTGEKKRPLPLVHTKNAKYVGIDIKYPSECMIEDQYLESVLQLDGLVGNKTKINTEAIIDAVAEGEYSKNDVKMIKFLASKIVAHNRVFTTLKEIEENTGIPATHVSRWFKQNQGICKVLKNRNGFVVDVHPFLVYKGAEEWRSYAVSCWCSGIPLY